MLYSTVLIVLGSGEFLAQDGLGPRRVEAWNGRPLDHRFSYCMIPPPRRESVTNNVKTNAGRSLFNVEMKRCGQMGTLEDHLYKR